jgi:hypothetical protein
MRAHAGKRSVLDGVLGIPRRLRFLRFLKLSIHEGNNHCDDDLAHVNETWIDVCTELHSVIDF